MSDRYQSINELDLEPIMVKIMDSDEGLGWSLELTQRVVIEYKRFLILCLEKPEFAMVPSTLVDDFWHFHILDTQNYQQDCQDVFGYFLHHFPYFGMRSEEDAGNLIRAWTASCALYEERFGFIDKEIWAASKRCPNCGRKGGNTDFREDRPRLKLAA